MTAPLSRRDERRSSERPLGCDLFALTVADGKIQKIEKEAAFATHAPAENEIDVGGARLANGKIAVGHDAKFLLLDEECKLIRPLIL